MARRVPPADRQDSYAPRPKKGKKGQAAPPTGPLSRRTDFDTSQIVPVFRTTLNDHQVAAWDLMGDRRVTLLLGPAGTAKTHCAVARGLHELINARTVGRVVLVRPAVEAGERLGFLPGDMQAKVDPFFRPIYDLLDDAVGWKGALRDQVNEHIEVAPVAFMRGRTLKDSFVVVDEAQNCTWAQLKMVMSRIGKGSKMVVTGDPAQSDLTHRGRNPLARLVDNIRRKKLHARSVMGYYLMPPSAQVRDEAVTEVLKAFDDGLGDDDWPERPAPADGQAA
jgi:phosphate starvation-inducible PhoH-like protein